MVSRFGVTKEVEIDYGHRIQTHGSQCSQLHGHRGRIVVTISGPLQTIGFSTGMVLDFSDIKDILMDLHAKWDHALLLDISDPFLKAVDAQWKFDLADVGLAKVVRLDRAPTAENLAALAFAFIQVELDEKYLDNIKLVSVTFYETPTSSATVKA